MLTQFNNSAFQLKLEQQIYGGRWRKEARSLSLNAAIPTALRYLVVAAGIRIAKDSSASALRPTLSTNQAPWRTNAAPLRRTVRFSSLISKFPSGHPILVLFVLHCVISELLPSFRICRPFNDSPRRSLLIHLSVSPPKFEGDAGLKLEKVFRGHPFMTSAKFSDFWTPPVHIWSQYTVLNPRNLLYIVHISTNHPCPSPLGADIINGRPLRGVIPFAMVRKNIA